MIDRPRIAVLRTGGTIDSIGASRLDLAAYSDTGQRLADGGLVEAIPEVQEVAAVDEISFRRLSSTEITAADWLELGRTVTTALDQDNYDGVVVTHGTNTLEETAYFVNLTVGAPAPVVLVGAMRPFSALSADGPLNLHRAVQVASSEEARGQGVLVLMNDTIFSARDVTKAATYRVDGFHAADLGPLGYADADGRIVFYHHQTRASSGAPFRDVLHHRDLPRVDVVVSYVGADGVMMDAAVAAGARGLVSAGAGAGRPTAAEDEAIDRAVAGGVVVCQSSRVGAGRVGRIPSLVQRGVVAADNLQPWKARVLLALALTRTSDPEEIQRLFDDA